MFLAIYLFFFFLANPPFHPSSRKIKTSPAKLSAIFTDNREMRALGFPSDWIYTLRLVLLNLNQKKKLTGFLYEEQYKYLNVKSSQIKHEIKGTS